MEKYLEQDNPTLFCYLDLTEYFILFYREDTKRYINSNMCRVQLKCSANHVNEGITALTLFLQLSHFKLLI